MTSVLHRRRFLTLDGAASLPLAGCIGGTGPGTDDASTSPPTTTAAGTLYAFDATDGTPLWSHRTAEVQVQDTVGRTIYGVTPVDGAVYVSARDAMHGLGPREHR